MREQQEERARGIVRRQRVAHASTCAVALSAMICLAAAAILLSACESGRSFSCEQCASGGQVDFVCFTSRGRQQPACVAKPTNSSSRATPVELQRHSAN